jgi:hypothetical protein
MMEWLFYRGSHGDSWYVRPARPGGVVCNSSPFPLAARLEQHQIFQRAVKRTTSSDFIIRCRIGGRLSDDLAVDGKGGRERGRELS